MKKVYTTPCAEKINFNYKNQVVASNETEPVTNACNFVGTFSFLTDGCYSTPIGGQMNK